MNDKNGKLNSMSTEELKDIVDNSFLYDADVVEYAETVLKDRDMALSASNSKIDIEIKDNQTKTNAYKNGMFTAYAKMFKNYANFKGRSSRGDFWYASLMNSIIMLLLYVIVIPPLISMINAVVVGSEYSGTSFQIISLLGGGVLYLLWLCATLIPSLALSVRRLHDIGKSGWWYFICCVPIVGAIILLVYMATKGDGHANRYGDNPLNETSKIPAKGVKIGFITLIVLAVLSIVGAFFTGTSFTNISSHAEGNIELLDDSGNVVLDKYDIIGAKAKYDENQGWYIELRLNNLGQEKFVEATEHTDFISIYVDNELITSLRVEEKVDSDTVIITGNFTKEHAAVLANKIVYADFAFGNEYNDELYKESNKPNSSVNNWKYMSGARSFLNVPEKPSIKAEVGEPYYWDVGECELVYVSFYENGEMVAAASFDYDTGEAVKDIMQYIGASEHTNYPPHNIKYDSKEIDDLELSGLYKSVTAICSVSMFTGEAEPEINGKGVIEGNLGPMSYRGTLFETEPNLFLVEFDVDETDETFWGDVMYIGFSINGGIILDMYLDETHIGTFNMTEQYIS